MKYYCYLVVLIGFYYSHSALILDSNITTPKYCIDNNVLEIFKERYSNCMIGEEITFLYIPIYNLNKMRILRWIRH